MQSSRRAPRTVSAEGLTPGSLSSRPPPSVGGVRARKRFTDNYRNFAFLPLRASRRGCRVGVFSEREKILICSAGFVHFHGKPIRNGLTEVVPALPVDNFTVAPAVLDIFLELSRGFSALAFAKVYFSANESWIRENSGLQRRPIGRPCGL